MKTLFKVMLMSGIVLSACNSSKQAESSTASLIGTEWKIATVYGEQATGENEPTMGFDSTKVYGNAGCNNYFATYTQDGDKLTFAQAGSTRMACADAGTEDAILKAVNEVASFQMTDSCMTLFNAAGDCILELKK